MFENAKVDSFLVTVRLYAPGNRMLGLDIDPTDEIGLDVDISYKHERGKLCNQAVPCCGFQAAPCRLSLGSTLLLPRLRF